MSYNPNNPNGQTTKANSAPVVIASDQDIATSANQTSANTKLDQIHADLIAALPTGANTIGAVNVNGTVPVSASALPLPSGAATAANQSTEITALNQLHTDLIAALPAGTNTIGNVNVLGGNATAVKVDGSAVTQPVSGTVTVNAGTNLNTSALALDATLTGGTQRTKVTDGTNNAAVKAASTAAVATDPALVVAVSPNNTVGVTGTFWQTTQPVSGTVTANAGTGSFTVAQATAANLNATVTGTVAATQSGTWTVQPGNTANTTPWLAKISDGTNAATIKAASTAAAATDPSLVVSVSPNNSVAVTQATAANLNATVSLAASQTLATVSTVTTLSQFAASAAAADATANPTSTVARTVGHKFNGTSWDRDYNVYNTTTGDTGTKTASFTGATQTNFNARGAYITVLCGTVSGTTPTLNAQLQFSPDAGTTWINIGAASGNATATGNTILFQVAPLNWTVAGATPAALTTGATQTVQLNAQLPRTWRLNYTIGGTTPSFAITAVYVNYLL
jgi:hypothetical protein